MRFFEAPDGHNEPTIWLDTDTDTMARAPLPVISKWELGCEDVRRTWPHIVRALTAGPTLESARVVIDTLREENQALLRANAELNDELNSLRTVIPAGMWDRLAES